MRPISYDRFMDSLKYYGLDDEDINLIKLLNPTLWEIEELLDWLEHEHDFYENPFGYERMNYIKASKLYYATYFEEKNREWITILQEH
ncbi:MAG: hypothetical protein IKP12_02005 [Acholeplasmatales bacterium]|nr:hypothetical protein [Acholeplasmatales bacterium]